MEDYQLYLLCGNACIILLMQKLDAKFGLWAIGALWIIVAMMVKYA